MRLSICGAFNATVKVRPGETQSQAAERVEIALQKVMDQCVKRFDVRIGVDFGAIEVLSAKDK